MARGIMRAALLAGMTVMVPAHAGATNGNKPRTPVSFDHLQCLGDVDRSSDVEIAFHYGIPLEEAAVGPDELADSRTHQFVALCRDHLPDEKLPNWVLADDAARSLDAGIITDLPDPESVLETASEWQVGHDGNNGSCVHFIGGSANRRPITCDGSADPVVWDTTGVPVGGYVVRGYTFEPDANLWSVRAGVVRVHDGDPSAAGPVATLVSPTVSSAKAHGDDGYVLRGCAAGMPGTTVTISWALITDLTQWTDVDELETGEASCGFEVDFFPPPRAEGQALVFRAVARDPMGRSFTGHAPGKVIVLPGEGTSDDPDPLPAFDVCGGVEPPPEDAVADCSPVGGGGSTGGASTTGADSGSSGGTGDPGSTGDAGTDGGDAGADADALGADQDCSCRGERGAPTGSGLALLLGCCLVRRRAPAS